jgi:hypothetical protein
LGKAIGQHRIDCIQLQVLFSEQFPNFLHV